MHVQAQAMFNAALAQAKDPLPRPLLYYHQLEGTSLQSITQLPDPQDSELA